MLLWKILLSPKIFSPNSCLISSNIANRVDPVAIVSAIKRNGFSGRESKFLYEHSATQLLSLKFLLTPE